MNQPSGGLSGGFNTWLTGLQFALAYIALCIHQHGFEDGLLQVGFLDLDADDVIVLGNGTHPVHSAVLQQGRIIVLCALLKSGHDLIALQRATEPVSVTSSSWMLSVDCSVLELSVGCSVLSCGSAILETEKVRYPPTFVA